MKSKEIIKFREDYTKYEKDCVFEGYKLAVLFDEKDWVKRIGGRWDAGEQTWWMPESKLLNSVHDNGTLVRDELNYNKMIMGQYGEFQHKPLNPNNASEYSLYSKHADGPRYTVQWWDNNDAVSFSQSLPNGTFGINCPDAVWYTVEDARTRWNELVNRGYNRGFKP